MNRCAVFGYAHALCISAVLLACCGSSFADDAVKPNKSAAGPSGLRSPSDTFVISGKRSLDVLVTCELPDRQTIVLKTYNRAGKGRRCDITCSWTHDRTGGPGTNTYYVSGYVEPRSRGAIISQTNCPAGDFGRLVSVTASCQVAKRPSEPTSPIRECQGAGKG